MCVCVSVTCTTNHELSINLLLFSIRFRVSSLVVVSFVYELNILFCCFIHCPLAKCSTWRRSRAKEEAPTERQRLLSFPISLTLLLRCLLCWVTAELCHLRCERENDGCRMETQWGKMTGVKECAQCRKRPTGDWRTAARREKVQKKNSNSKRNTARTTTKQQQQQQQLCT